MNDACRRVLEWSDCLLDPQRTPADQRQAADEWCTWGLERLGIDENVVGLSPEGFAAETSLGTGWAISPLNAARCLREFRRTAVFLQALDAAIRAARERFPGERIHVVEAGCGPLAPLVLPFALRHAAAEVDFTLIDLHEVSLDAAARLAEELGVAASIRARRAGDAAAMRFTATDRPHVIVCEVLRRALKQEPQVAVTRALAAQLRAGGFFLPERIDVDLGFLDSGRRFRRMTGQLGRGEPEPIERLGRAFTLDAYRAEAPGVNGARKIAGGTVRIPPPDQLVGLDDREQLIHRVQPGEIITGRAVEKSPLPEIDITESQQRPGRRVPHHLLQPPPPAHPAELQTAATRSRGERRTRLPVRIAVVLLDEYVDRRKCVMVHLALQPPGAAFDHDVLMNLVVAAAGVAVDEALVAAEPMPEKTQVPVGIVGMFQPAVHEHEPAVDPVAVRRMRRIGRDRAEFRAGFRRQHLVGIEDEDPLVAPGQVFQRPVFFLRPSAVEFKLDDPRAKLFRDAL